MDNINSHQDNTSFNQYCTNPENTESKPENPINRTNEYWYECQTEVKYVHDLNDGYYSQMEIANAYQENAHGEFFNPNHQQDQL